MEQDRAIDPVRQRRGSALARILLIVLSAWAVAMILPASYRLVEPLGAFGVTADNDGWIIDVVAPFDTASRSPAAMAGLRPGDRLDLRRMRCDAPRSPGCVALVAVLGGLGGVQYALPDRQLELTVLPGGQGPPRTLHLIAALAPLSGPGRLVLLFDTIVGVVFVGTAFHLVWTRPGRMTWGFFLYAVWFNPGQTYTYYALLQPWPVAVIAQQLAEGVAHGAAFAGLLAFALRFPTSVTDRLRLCAAAVAPSAGVVIALMTLLSTANLFGYPTEKVAETAFLSGYAVDGAALLLLVLRRHRLQPQDRERMNWAIAGCGIGIPSFIFAEICQSSSLLHMLSGIHPSQTVIGLLYLPQGVIAYFVGTAVRRRRVVRVAIPLRHGTVLTGLALGLGIPIVHLHEAIANYQESLHLPEWIWPLVVGPIVLLVGHRLHETAVHLVDHVFSRRFHQAQNRLKQSARAMQAASTFAEIDRLLAEEPVRGFRLSSAAVFRWADGVLRRAEPTIGWNGNGVRELRRDLDALVLQSLDRGVPVRLPRGAWLRPGVPADDHAPCIAVPVCGGAKEGIAVALFGPHETGSDIDADECAMLEQFAAQAGLAYDRVETDLLRSEVRRLRVQLAAIQGASTIANSPAEPRRDA